MMLEAADEGLTELLATLWLKNHSLVAELLFLMQHNTRERRLRVECAAKYRILPMHLLRYLNFNLNTW